MSIILTILSTIFVLSVVTATYGYAFVWYDRANSEPQLMAERFTPRNILFFLRLLTKETLALSFTILLHPAGWFRPKILPATHASGVPILFLHGLFQNRSCWTWIKYRLRRKGYRSLHDINLPPWKDVEILTERVSKKVDELRLASGVDKVILVGHSMGGIIARNYLQIRGGADKVEKCILLAPPNGGSRLATFALSKLGQSLLPSSDFMKHLRDAPLPSEIPITAVYSRHDNIVIPYESGQLKGARNIELTDLGHTSLLYSPSVFILLLDEIREATT